MKITEDLLNTIRNKKLLTVDDDITFFKSHPSKTAKLQVVNKLEEILSEEIKEIILNADGDPTITLVDCDFEVSAYYKVVELYKIKNAKLIIPNENGLLILHNLITQLDNLSHLYSDLRTIDLRWIDVRYVDNLSELFKYRSFKTIDLRGWNTGQTTSFESMFESTWYLNNIYGIENFNTSKAENFELMFCQCGTAELSIDLSKWDTTNVKTFRLMFLRFGGYSVGNLANWHFDNITESTSIKSNMEPQMFSFAKNLKYIGDISNWNIINKHLLMDNFFEGCTNLKDVGDLSKWADNKFISVNYMFDQCGIETDLSNWTLQSVIEIGYNYTWPDHIKEAKYLMMINSKMPKDKWPPLAVKAYNTLIKLNLI